MKLDSSTSEDSPLQRASHTLEPKSSDKSDDDGDATMVAASLQGEDTGAEPEQVSERAVDVSSASAGASAANLGSSASPPAAPSLLEYLRAAAASALDAKSGSSAAKQRLPNASSSILLSDTSSSGASISPTKEQEQSTLAQANEGTAAPSIPSSLPPRRASSSRTIHAPPTTPSTVILGKSSSSQPARQGKASKATRGVLWEHEEDVTLATLVQKHGTKWPKVLKEFTKLSSTPRTEKALDGRWRNLTLSNGAKSPRTPTQVLSMLQKKTPSEEPAPEPSSPAKSPRSRSSKFGTAWTEEEEQVIRDSMDRHKGSTGLAPKVAADFFAKFKKSHRTHGSIRNRVYILSTRRDQREQGGENDDEEAEEEDEEEGEEEGEEEEENKVGEADVDEEEESTENSDSGVTFDAATLTREQAAAMLAQSLAQGALSRPANKHLNGALTGLLGENQVAGLGTPGARTFPQHPPVPQPSAQAPLPSSSSTSVQDVDVCITYQPNGILVTDLPRLFEIKVFSPTKVKVTRSATASRAPARKDARPPAFHFKCLEDGAIQALRLPEGTATSMAAVPAEEEDGGAAAAGRAGGVGVGQGMVVEHRFVAPDGYSVRLRGAS